MLNPLPDLLLLSFFAPFLLRVGLGLSLFLFGFIRLSGKRETYLERFTDRWPKSGKLLLFLLGGIEVLVGLALIVGFYTQIAALVSMVVALILLLTNKTKSLTGNSKSLYFLIFVISLSLLISGAGALAFDVPL